MLPQHLPTVQTGGSHGGKKKKKQSWLWTIIEFSGFLIWLGVTGYAGYTIGYDPASVKCPAIESGQSDASIPEEIIRNARLPPCPALNISSPSLEETKNEEFPALYKEGGYTYNELKSLWACSHGVGNPEELKKEIFPEGINLQKTKWKSIITVEPKAFFDKYLMQYPGDMRAVQPVVIFSHKPLEKFEEISDICKVLDIAIVPDKPGTCVAVTETYHDVASYHMLHADRQSDGSFSLSSNFVDGRTLPDDTAYGPARALLLEFFKHGEKVMAAMKEVPRYTKGKVVIGVMVDDPTDIELFLNSFQSAKKAGINKGKFVIFTTSEQVKNDLDGTGIKILYFPYLAELGKSGEGKVSPKLRRYFLQTWFAFSAANDLIKVMWQSPATIWYDRPDNIVNAFPAVETLWSFKGRKDGRAAPFFVSFDFFVAVGVERPVHFLHELLLHFDLIVAWDSLDAVAAYRLSENNSR
jgi:hypothetical protein